MSRKISNYTESDTANKSYKKCDEQKPFFSENTRPPDEGKNRNGTPENKRDKQKRIISDSGYNITAKKRETHSGSTASWTVIPCKGIYGTRLSHTAEYQRRQKYIQHTKADHTKIYQQYISSYPVHRVTPLYKTL